MDDIRMILNTIMEIYEKEVFTVSELYDILLNIGYKKRESRLIILNAINTGEMGKVSYRRNITRMPSQNTSLYLKRKKRNTAH